jgi:hypothetical protein
MRYWDYPPPGLEAGSIGGGEEAVAARSVWALRATV